MLKYSNMSLKIVSYLYGGCFLTMFTSSFRIFFLQGSSLPIETIQKELLGQFGALALSVIGLYVAGRFIHKLLERNRKLEEEIKNIYKKRIEDLEK